MLLRCCFKNWQVVRVEIKVNDIFSFSREYNLNITIKIILKRELPSIKNIRKALKIFLYTRKKIEEKLE